MAGEVTQTGGHDPSGSAPEADGPVAPTATDRPDGDPAGTAGGGPAGDHQAAEVLPTSVGAPDGDGWGDGPQGREPSVGRTAPTPGEPLLVEELGPVERAPVPAETTPPPPVDALRPAELRPVVEALLFVATRPLTIERLAACLPGADADHLEGFLRGLADRFDQEARGWALVREAGGWRLLTRAAHHPWVRQLERKELPQRLSRGALETLAVVAYRQPVARGVIEDVRGVQCSHVITQLLDLKLIRVVGRDEHALGRPWLYGTTDQFLTRFGLGSVNDLPRRHEFGG